MGEKMSSKQNKKKKDAEILSHTFTMPLMSAPYDRLLRSGIVLKILCALLFSLLVMRWMRFILVVFSVRHIYLNK